MRRILILLVVLLILALGIFFMEKPRIEKERAVREGKTEVNLLFSELKKEAISAITIHDGMTLKTIKREGEGWVISDDGERFHKAEEGKIDELIENITEELTEETLASSSPDRHEKYEVTEGLGTVVSVYTEGDDPAAVFYVGKQGPDMIRTYVRKVDGSDVFSIPIQLGTIYGRDMNGWRDKHLWEFDPALVVEVVFEFGEDLYHVRKEEDSWKLLIPEEAPAIGIKIESELQALSEIEGAGFSMNTIEESGLSEPESTISLTMADGGTLKAYFSSEDAGYVNAYVGGNQDDILKISNTTFGPLKITALSQLKLEEEEGEGEDEDSEGNQTS